MLKNIFMCAVLAVMAVACAKTPAIEGTWIQPIPGFSSGEMQGITLEKGGKASSVNMATLTYETWTRNGNTLVLTGKSLGNGQTIEVNLQYNIKELTDDTLALSADGEETQIFTRQK